jgi:pimeloyl-ACP methyl ester carboxylesterase
MLIWNVNQNIFGNPFFPCLILSTTTFLIIYSPFEIYWSFRDIWFNRWKPIKIKNVITSKIRIEVITATLKKIWFSALLISDIDASKRNDAIVIIVHGFSDNKESLQYFYYPLVVQGYTILAYDARGTGQSKKAGKRSDFIKRIDDLKEIIKWVQKEEDLRDKKLYIVGFSIGSLAALIAGLPNDVVEKIVAISSISNYKKNLPKFNPILILNYFIRGVKCFPNASTNEKLSPALFINAMIKQSGERVRKIIAQKVFLMHAKNDKIIRVNNFEENSRILDIPSYRKLLFNKGGHSLKKNELCLVAGVLKFFRS